MRYYLKRYKMPVVYAVAVPLALILGCLVSWLDPFSFAMLGMILLFLALPLFLKWHHALMIIFWNSAFNAFFLPGQPDVWLLFAAFSFGVSFLNHVMFQKEFLRAPEMRRSLLCLAAVVVATALYRGGFGIRSLGMASMGGKYYVFILVAILGYFALTAEQVPVLRSGRMAGLFFLSGTTFVLGNLAYALGPASYFMYYFVPAGVASFQAATEFGLTSIDRISGLSQASFAAVCFLLARYGLRRLFDWTKPWRLLFLCVAIGASFFAGFRSAIMLLVLLIAIQFLLEGLLRTRLLPVMLGLVIFVCLPLLLLSDRMPPVVQRAISFLPVKLDADVRADARGSTEWRLQMWEVVLKDVPKYLLIGKGYGIDPTDMYLTTEGIRMGLIPTYEESMLAGDYHSGPLSVIIPFGIFGGLAFLWVLFAGFRIMHANYRHGDARLRRINTTLFAYYLTNCFAFFFIFGAFNSSLSIFLGMVGLSVSLNGGVRKNNPSNGKHISVPEPLVVVLK